MRASKILILLILVGSLLSAGLAAKKFALDRDYPVEANVPCDPTIHSCFVGDGDTNPAFYESIRKKAYLIPACDGWADQCPVLSCSPSDGEGCTETFCEEGGDTPCYHGAPPPADSSDATGA